MQQRLLFIDDDQTLIDILQYYFPRHFEVLCLRSPKGIEHHVSSFAPHIIVMDVFLGAQDGRIVCKELKDNIKYAHIPILLTSATAFEADQFAMYKASGFIQKPFTHLDQLTATIKSYLQPSVVHIHNRRKAISEDISSN
jgi:DNA-binding response OmpR family regulator